MGRGLSSLQTDILTVLDQWPSFEQASAATPGKLDHWAFPRDIIERLGLPKNNVTSASVSRALWAAFESGDRSVAARLYEAILAEFPNDPVATSMLAACGASAGTAAAASI